MYTEVIGQRVLDTWTHQTGEVLTAREFFDSQYYPVFLAHDRLLQWVNNSPFAQGRGSQTPAQRLAQRTKLHELLAAATAPGGSGLDMSLAPGFPAGGTTGTTAGQVSDRAPVGNGESGYRAWLGAAAGIGVAGGLCLALTEEKIIGAVMEGWAHYRALLTAYPTLKGNQVETWNGQWVAHRFGPAYDPALPYAGLDPHGLLEGSPAAYNLPTHSWVNLLLRLAEVLPDTTAYVYALGQTNRTVGFVGLRLAELTTLRQLAHGLFTLTGTGESWAVLSQVYETRLGLARACEQGSLGLVALEPARLRLAMATTLGVAKTPAQARQQEIYQLWLTAMLHQTATTTGPSGPELSAAAERLATSLRAYAVHEPGKNKGRAKTNFGQLVQGAFVPSVRLFIEQLTKMLNATPHAPDYREVFLEAVALVQQLPQPRYLLYQAVLKFNYAAKS